MNEDKTPLVSVVCLTYNHAPYIRECMDGFLMQKTDFPIEVIIHDDASTDGTTDIIKEYASKYPDIIKPIIQTENQYSKHHDFNRIMQSCIEKAIGKYIALCEGDDYWTDSSKLYKQIQFLEKESDYGLCYTKVERLDVSRNKIKDKWGQPLLNKASLLLTNPIPTPSVVIRKKIYMDYYNEISPSKRNWAMGDYPLWLYTNYVSNIKFLDIISGVYRIITNSASHQSIIENQIDFTISFKKIALFFANRYNNGNKDHINTLNDIIRFKLFQKYFITNDKNNLKIITNEILTSSKNIKYKLFIFFSYFMPKSLITKYIINRYKLF
ncbi:MAG: glycosyltransferase [Muribaculaceae bacterium]|nr:glycosyltransferase [Muribaculaceae bacterium]